jgi:HEAT repeat protein
VLRVETPGRGQQAAALDGLAETGSRDDLPLVEARLSAPGPRVRVGAVRAVCKLAPAEAVGRLLAPLLLDPVARVSASAAAGLTRAGVTPYTL